jgi:hypothetical protein
MYKMYELKTQLIYFEVFYVTIPAPLTFSTCMLIAMRFACLDGN